MRLNRFAVVEVGFGWGAPRRCVLLRVQRAPKESRPLQRDETARCAMPTFFFELIRGSESVILFSSSRCSWGLAHSLPWWDGGSPNL